MTSSPTAPFAAGALALVPAPVFARLVAWHMRGMRRLHPSLFRNFGRLDPATVHVNPTDLPHRFVIAFGGGKMDVRVRPDAGGSAADATISASLATLIELLEGRIDGDSMFFSRDLEISGSTAVIVAVRNTLDREEIVLRDDLAALFGPFKRPARRAGRLLERAIGRAHNRIAAVHAGLHASGPPERETAAEYNALRAEVRALQAQFAKLDVRRKHNELAATGVS